MCVLHRLANLQEKLEARNGRERILLTVVGNLCSPDQFHHEKGPAASSRAGVEDMSDIRMIHQRQGLPLSFKAGDDALGVHPRLDHLKGYAPPNRFLLLSHEHHATAAFADLL